MYMFESFDSSCGIITVFSIHCGTYNQACHLLQNTELAESIFIEF